MLFRRLKLFYNYFISTCSSKETLTLTFSAFVAEFIAKLFWSIWKNINLEAKITERETFKKDLFI